VKWLASFALLVFLSLISPAAAQEWPYFITYSHDMEEPGNLEINLGNVAGNPLMGNRFVGSALEFEYGLKTWWTTEFYLDGQITQHDSTIFTGLPAVRSSSMATILPPFLATAVSVPGA